MNKITTSSTAAPGTVRIDRIARPGRPTAVVVHLPATQQWFPTRGANPIDGETNVIRSSRTFRDLDPFIADARERYDSGEGLL